jgi:hypothetical protein
MTLARTVVYSQHEVAFPRVTLLSLILLYTYMIPPKALQTTPIALRDHSLSLIILHTNNSAATTMDNLKVYNDTIDLMEELNAKDRALALSEAWQLFSIPPYERR